jgi:hypothetical protein
MRLGKVSWRAAIGRARVGRTCVHSHRQIAQLSADARRPSDIILSADQYAQRVSAAIGAADVAVGVDANLPVDLGAQ